ncbi:MAG TPA: DUF3267 domain-containing protein [Propionicimonas sp.]|nr:DUF3267 domain-containing protein [Propionicimonas sp.]
MSQAYELRPSRRDLIWLNLGSVGLALVGVMVALVVRGTLWPGTTTVGVVEIVLVLVTTVTLAVMHEAIHGVAMIAVGIRPRFGLTRFGGSVPALYTTAKEPGTTVTVREFALICLAPIVLLNLVVLCALVFCPAGGWLVIPGAVHLAGCVGDLWLWRQARRQPVGSRFEDLVDGLRIHPEPALR